MTTRQFVLPVGTDGLPLRTELTIRPSSTAPGRMKVGLAAPCDIESLLACEGGKTGKVACPPLSTGGLFAEWREEMS